MQTRILTLLTICAALGLLTAVACNNTSTQVKPTTLGDGGTVQVTPDPNAESQPSR